jgi:hypothetical protein
MQYYEKLLDVKIINDDGRETLADVVIWNTLDYVKFIVSNENKDITITFSGKSNQFKDQAITIQRYANGFFSYRLIQEEYTEEKKTLFGKKTTTKQKNYYEVILNADGSILKMYLPFTSKVQDCLRVINYQEYNYNNDEENEEKDMKALIRSLYPDRDEY